MVITSPKILKNTCICIWVLAFFFLNACTADMYCGKRPTDYPGSKWVCDDPNMMFMIDQSEQVSCEINGDPLPNGCFLAFGPGTLFWLHDNESGTTLLRGESKYSPDKMDVDVELDDYFGGSYSGKRIVFYRVK